MSNPKLKNVFVCESVVVAFNGQLSLINLISEITSTAFPAIHPKLTILVSILGNVGVYDEKIEIFSVNENKTIATVSGKVEIKDIGGNNFIASFINTVFQSEGKYWVKVTLGSDILTNQEEHSFTLKKV